MPVPRTSADLLSTAMRRAQVRRMVLHELLSLAPDERPVLLADVLAELMMPIGPPAQAVHASVARAEPARIPHVRGDASLAGQSKVAELVALLTQVPGRPCAELAIVLYGENTARTRRRVHSLLGSLRQQNAVHKLGPGRWAATTPASRTEVDVQSPKGTWEAFVVLMSREWLAPLRRLLSALKQARRAVPVDDLRKALGASSTSSVVGTVVSVVNHARKLGLDPANVIVRGRREYGPGPLLLQETLPWAEEGSDPMSTLRQTSKTRRPRALVTPWASPPRRLTR